MTHDLRRLPFGVLSAGALTLVVHYALAAPEPAATPATPAPEPRELPSYMIPNIPDAAEAYWAPDSRYLIAQTRDPSAVRNSRGGLGALTYIFTDDGEESWRINDRGQDACSF